MRPLVYVDSEAALAEARRDGLIPEDAEIRSFAPALNGRPGIARADKDVTPAHIRALEKAVLAASTAMYRDYAERPDEALVLARACIAELSMMAYHALALSDEDCDRDLRVIGIGFANREYALRIGPPFAMLTGPGHPFGLIEIDEGRISGIDQPAPTVAPIWTRLTFASRTSLGYRFAAKISRALGRSGPKGSILVIRENELLKDTAFALAKRGFAIHLLRYPTVTEAEAVAAAPRLDDRFVSCIQDCLRAALPERVAALVARGFKGRAERALGRYRVLSDKLSDAIGAMSHLRPQGILSNVKFEAEAVAIRTAAQRKRLPNFVFSHGFAAETSEREVAYHARHENALGDVSFVFTKTAKETLDRNPMRVGDCAAVGLSSEYARRRMSRPPAGLPPVWYISTALYNGTMPIMCVGYTDNQIADYEKDVVRNVLAPLPHRVMYKAYPAYRYIDPDPVLTLAAAQPNIELYLDRIDLRYIVSKARIFVTSRATSTMSLCLFSGRPTIFIDHPDQVPLRDDARAAFRDGAFLIDARNPDWQDEARALLSRPLEDIENAWREKDAARRDLIRRFFSDPLDGHAGRRAADIIRNRIQTIQASR